MDVYDEVDRRETDAGKLLCLEQNEHVCIVYMWSFLGTERVSLQSSAELCSLLHIFLSSFCWSLVQTCKPKQA